jgi:peptidyl-prolyl cis-trans isomerase C
MGRNRFPPIALTISLIAVTLFSSSAHAQDDDPIVATVNGADVFESEVEGPVAALTRQYPSAPKAQLRRQVLNRLVERRLIAQAAINQGLNKDPAVLRRLEDIRQNLLQEVYLSRRAEAEITDEVLRAAYEEGKIAKTGEIEVHARHILLEDEAAAKSMISQLDGGADFADLAKEHSTGPTADRGGDLGFFPKGAMVTPFSDAAFSHEPGSYTGKPVKTQFGWHVIKVEERRAKPVPTFEESVEDLSSQLISEMVDDLRASADVKIFTDNPEPGK